MSGSELTDILGYESDHDYRANRVKPCRGCLQKEHVNKNGFCISCHGTVETEPAALALVEESEAITAGSRR